MRPWPPELAAALAAPGVETRLAVCVEALDTAAGVVRELGYWTGGHQLTLTLDGRECTFEPIGAALAHEDLPVSVGGLAQRYRVAITGQQGDLSVAMRDLSLELAPITLWRLVADQADRMQWHAIRLLKGWVDEVEARAGTRDQPGGIDLLVANPAVALTWTLEDRRHNHATHSRQLVTLSGTTTEVSSAISGGGPFTLNAGCEFVRFDVIGGGGGGAAYGNGGAPLYYGSAGGTSVAKLLDGGSVVQTVTAYGGASGGSSLGAPAGEPGPLAGYTSYGAGGDGLGAAGGNEWSRPAAPGGAAGQLVSTGWIDIRGLSSPSVDTSIGAGGAGASGAQPGTQGLVVVHQRQTSAGTTADDGFGQYAAIAPTVSRVW